VSSDQLIRAIETEYNGYRFRSRLEARWAVFFDTLGVSYEYEKEGFETEAGRYLPDFWLPQFGAWYEIKPSYELSQHDEKRLLAFAQILGDQWQAQHNSVKVADPFVKDLLALDQFVQEELSSLLSKHLSSVEQEHIQTPLRQIRALFNIAANTVVHTRHPRLESMALVLCVGEPWIGSGKAGYSTHRVLKKTLPGLAWGVCRGCSRLILPFQETYECRCGNRESIGLDWQAPNLVQAYSAARQARFEFGETPQPRRIIAPAAAPTPLPAQITARPMIETPLMLHEWVRHPRIGNAVVLGSSPGNLRLLFIDGSVGAFDPITARVVKLNRIATSDEIANLIAVKQPRENGQSIEDSVRNTLFGLVLSGWDEVCRLVEQGGNRLLAAVVWKMEQAWPHHIEGETLVLGTMIEAHAVRLIKFQSVVEQALAAVLGQRMLVRAEVMPETTRPATA
jgi:hypothetical protein